MDWYRLTYPFFIFSFILPFQFTAYLFYPPEYYLNYHLRFKLDNSHYEKSDPSFIPDN